MIFDELDTYLREKKKRKNTCPCKSRSREDDRFSSKLRSFRNDKGNCKKIKERKMSSVRPSNSGCTQIVGRARR